MENLSKMGRIFYGIAMAALGLQTMYEDDFPYMLLPPNHYSHSALVLLAYITATILILAGVCIVLEKKTRPIALILGWALLLIFCLYYIPYELLATSNYMHWGEWENAEKELALSSGAFIIAGCFSGKQDKPFIRFLGKLIPFGVILYPITIICFAIDHFIYAKDAADYIPSWVPNHIFWIYFAGIALFGAGAAIILKIKTGLFAALLGTMIFIWFIILHIPKAILSPFPDRVGELTSAFLALAYSGIAFVIAGAPKKTD
jgi:uncharacterized membrane protein YphA (DoxX/SURF4 family)